ncbi:G-protein coupled receptor Mth2-like [Epargyreus clarus]|uniref:G-protein coupled receptor Mth2-like n=1 Tax=Epargyreus clarus TaxID=520877 RepID=UPI003C2EB23F
MKFLVISYFLFSLLSQATCTPCSRTESLNITSGVILPNGNVLYGGIEFSSDKWYEVEEDGVNVRFGCPCIGRICIWKCCNAREAFYNRSCTETDLPEVNPFSPAVYNGRNATNITAHQHFFYMHKLSCEKYVVDSISPYEEIYIQENGTLYEIAATHPQWHAPTRYCVDMMLDSSSPDPRLVAGVCYPEEEASDDSPALYIAYAIGLMLSVPFLIATFLVYAFIPELRNLHGMCLMAYCFGLIIAYSFLAYLKLHVGRVGVAMTGCYVIAFIVYYAFQTSFFWLNVMCFDIWRTFSGYRGGSSHKRREKKRFAAYGAYAWGVPVVLTAITIAMQFSDLPSNIITPGFGSKRCWFNDWTSELVYFFIPVLVLVVCNVVLFSVTAYRIRSIRQETAILKSSESSRSDKLKKDKQRYGLYLKLFVVMGVNWTIEIISFAVGGSNWYWVVVDISNIVLGLFIFFIFVWKNKVRNLAAKKWRSIRGKPAATDTSLGRWATQSSSAPTENTRVSTDETTIRLKDMH